MIKFKLTNKQARKLKRLSGHSSNAHRQYIASCVLGVQCKFSALNAVYKTEEKKAVTYLSFYRDITERYNSKNKAANLTKYIKIARALKITPSQLKNNTRYCYGIADIVQVTKQAIKDELKKRTLSVPVSPITKRRESLLKQFQIGAVTRPDQLDASATYYGVEVECLVDESIDTRAIAERMKVKNLSIKSDGSIRTEGNDLGVEFTMLLNKKTLRADLENFGKFLKAINARVNQSCGLHVHLDMRHKTKANITTIAKRLSCSLDVLKQLVPASRRNNSYCQLGVSRRRGSRYYAVNMTALQKYNTIEIRLHSGTTDFEKIYNWIQLLTVITETKNATRFETFESMAEKLRLSSDLTQFYTARRNKFNGTSTHEHETGGDNDAVQLHAHGQQVLNANNNLNSIGA